MKILLILLLSLAPVLFSPIKPDDPSKKVYKLISLQKVNLPKFHTSGLMAVVDTINLKLIVRNEPLKALAAYYSSLADSNCDGHTCGLTTALGLGSQGSAEHKNLLLKYFPNDTIVKNMLKINCWVGINGSSNFYTYHFLTFEQSHDTVSIDYQINHYDHGKGSNSTNHDIAILSDKVIVFIKR